MDRYWVGGGAQNWDDTGPTHWSASSGGADNASVPANGDDVFLDTADNCTMNVTTADLNSFDMTGYTGTLSGNGDLYVVPASGTVACKFTAGSALTGNDIFIDPQGTAVVNLTSAGNTFRSLTLCATGASTATVSLQDAVDVLTIGIKPHTGIFLTNGFAVTTTGDLKTQTGSVTYNITNSTVTCVNWWPVGSDTVTATGSTIISSGAFFFTENKTYGNVTLTGDGLQVVDGMTCDTLSVNTAGLATGIIFNSGKTYTVTDFATNGFAANLAKILSSSGGSAFTLTTGSAEISVDYMSIKDSTASEADTWYAGANSTDVSGNSGWVFTAPPVISIGKFMGVSVGSIGKVNGVAIADLGKILGVDKP